MALHEDKITKINIRLNFFNYFLVISFFEGEAVLGDDSDHSLRGYHDVIGMKIAYFCISSLVE